MEHQSIPIAIRCSWKSCWRFGVQSLSHQRRNIQRKIRIIKRVQPNSRTWARPRSLCSRRKPFPGWVSSLQWVTLFETREINIKFSIICLQICRKSWESLPNLPWPSARFLATIETSKQIKATRLSMNLLLPNKTSRIWLNYSCFFAKQASPAAYEKAKATSKKECGQESYTALYE